MADTHQHNDSSLACMPLAAAVIVTVVSLAINLTTLHPGVGPSLDSIELQIGALVSGIVHPPGSPQYLMIGHLAMAVLPGPNLAYRLNLLSAIAGALTTGIVTLLIYRLKLLVVPAIFGGLSLSVSLLFWYQSSITELYAFNGLYVALTLYLLFSWMETKRGYFYWWAIIIYCLSFGNHTSMILLVPAFAYAIWVTDRSVLNPVKVLLTLLIIGIAAAQYLYIPIRAAANPLLCNYCPGLLPSPIDYLRGPLLDYMTGGPFKGAILTVPLNDVAVRLLDMMRQWNQQFLPWGCLLALVGIGRLITQNRKAAFLLSLSAMFEIAFVATYAIPDWYTFLTPVYIISAILIGYGSGWLIQNIYPSYREPDGQKVTLPVSAIYAMLVVMVMASGVVNWPQVDQSQNADFQTRGRALLDKAQPDASLMMARPTNLDAFIYSWSIEYLSVAEYPSLRLIIISAPEVNPPPGPGPHYVSWADASSMFDPEVTRELNKQVLVVDPADDRLSGMWLFPICYRKGESAGYQIVALQDKDVIIPIVAKEAWESVKALVVEGGSEPSDPCP